MAETLFSYSRLFSWYSWAAWLLAGLLGFGSSSKDFKYRTDIVSIVVRFHDKHDIIVTSRLNLTLIILALIINEKIPVLKLRLKRHHRLDSSDSEVYLSICCHLRTL